MIYFSQKPQVDTLKELADVTNMSRSRLALAMKKLTMKELIKVEDQVQLQYFWLLQSRYWIEL